MASRKPAILIIVENLPVPLDRRVWQESLALRDAGYEVVVICPKMRGWNRAYEERDGIHIYRHWISGEAAGLIGFVCEYASALLGELMLSLQVLRRHRVEIVHVCNPPDLLFLVALPLKLLAGVRVIYDVHDVWPEMFEAKFGRRGLFYWAVRLAEWCTYRTADVVLATNESVKATAVGRGGVEDRNVYVVRTAPKIGSTEVPETPALRQGRRYLVGYVGVMGNADGVHLLLEAAHHLVKTRAREDVRFLLMGTGPEYDSLVRQRDQLGLAEFVEMPGRVSDEFLFGGLRTMDLGVSSDPINGYNNHCTMNKVLEYMAFGKAQVMFDLKEGRASAGDAAVYVARNCPLELGDAIADLLDQPALRQEMGECGERRLREALNWERSVVQLRKAYRAVAG